MLVDLSPKNRWIHLMEVHVFMKCGCELELFTVSGRLYSELLAIFFWTLPLKKGDPTWKQS